MNLTGRASSRHAAPPKGHVEAYLERIARDEQAAEEELEALALEGLNSGESIQVDQQYWAEKRQRLIERHQKTGDR